MSFWEDKKTLVTGGHGFLGSYVLDELKARGATEIVAPTSQDCDLTSSYAVEKLLEIHQPNIVLHMAARVGGIGANKARPADFFYQNLMMGVQLFHQSFLHKVDKFVSVGTVCCYPKHTPIPFKEEDLWDGYPEETNAPYGLAKKMLLVAGDAYRNQYDFQSIFLLPANLYGPKDDFSEATSHVIPALIKRCVEAKKSGSEELLVWGTGRATREFLYVKDAARAIVEAAEKYQDPEPLNIGTGQEVSIRELVEQIRDLTGFAGRLRWDQSKPDGQPRRCLDTSRARNAFGFEAEVQLEEGLRETIDWYLSQN